VPHDDELRENWNGIAIVALENVAVFKEAKSKLSMLALHSIKPGESTLYEHWKFALTVTA